MKLFSYWRSLATYRVRVALNLKGLTPDEVIDVNLHEGQQREANYAKINPMMSLPSLILDDGTVLSESLAILEYLDETHPNPPLLPKEPKARARVRALSQMIACDTHPLIVPRVREYIVGHYNVDEAGINEWGRHWHDVALMALETNLANSPETGLYCQGDQLTIADICLSGQGVGAAYFKCDMSPYRTVCRIIDECAKLDSFARAHPLKQPGAPAAV